MTGYTITDVSESGDIHHVLAEVHTAQSSPVKLHFELARKDIGRKKDSLMTKSLKKET